MENLLAIGDNINQEYLTGGTTLTENTFMTFPAKTIGIKANSYPLLKWPSQNQKGELEGLFRNRPNEYKLMPDRGPWIGGLIDTSKLLGEIGEDDERGYGALHKQTKLVPAYSLKTALLSKFELNTTRKRGLRRSAQISSLLRQNDKLKKQHIH